LHREKIGGKRVPGNRRAVEEMRKNHEESDEGVYLKVVLKKKI